MASKSMALAPVGLLCELMENPENALICKEYPRFGWIVRDGSPNTMQSAYQILIASSTDTLAQNEGDLWDSGKVDSCESINVRYSGAPLASNTTYYWKMRTWNGNIEVGPYSEPQIFHTGEVTEEYVTERYPLVKHEIEPEQVVKRDDGNYFINFSKAAFGTVKLTLTSPDEREVKIHLGEAVTTDQSIDRNPGGTIRYREISLPLKKGTHTYIVAIPPDKRNTGDAAIKMPQDVGEVLPFRYCEIENCPCDIDSSMIRQIAVNYPFDDNAAHFESSDDILNAVWEICKYSIKATSFCGVYVDGDRERIPYEADAYINPWWPAKIGHIGILLI
ncbi:hypothetical protein ACFL6S_32930 [Candidatus Poribacteria bacterium]